MNHPYGPWATLISAGQNPQLSAFWRRRMGMLASVSKATPALSRRNIALLIAAAGCVFLLPTLRPAPIAAQQRQAGQDAAQAKGAFSPADDRDAAERRWSERYKSVNGTPAYTRPDMDIFFLPQHLGTELGPLDEFKLSDAQKEKLREICKDYFKQLSPIRDRTEKDWQKLSPRERSAKQKEYWASVATLNSAFGKRMDEVLTPEQVKAVKHAMLQMEATTDLNPRVGFSKQLGVTDAQKKQLAKLYSDREKQEADARREYPDRLLAVLGSQQREKLLGGIDERTPHVYLPPPPNASNQVIYSMAAMGPPNPFEFWFRSPGEAFVDVYADSGLDEAAIRKKLRLSDAQEEKLRTIHTAAKSAVDAIFKTYDFDAVALKKLSPQAQKEKLAAYEAKRDEFRLKLMDFGNDTRRQIEAVLDSQQLAAAHKSIRNRRAISALMPPERKTRDAIDATQQQREKLLDLLVKMYDPYHFERETGEEALKILTPEQRQRLAEEVERQGSL